MSTTVGRQVQVHREVKRRAGRLTIQDGHSLWQCSSSQQQFEEPLRETFVCQETCSVRAYPQDSSPAEECCACAAKAGMTAESRAPHHLEGEAEIQGYHAGHTVE